MWAQRWMWIVWPAFLVAAVLEYVMRWLKARLVDLGGKRADLAINATLLREIMSIRLEHRPQSIGIFSSSMKDFEALRDFFSSASLVVLADLPFVLVFILLIAIVGGPLAWVPALAVPVVLLLAWWVQKPLMVAMRENEERSRMLGYDPFRAKLRALAISGLYAGAAGAAGAAGVGFAPPSEIGKGALRFKASR